MTQLCIDMGGSHIKMGLVDNGRVHLARSFEVTPSFALPDLESMANVLLASSGTTFELDRAGIALPGVVDRRTGALVMAHEKYAGLVGIGLIDWARERFGVPTVVENDARASLVGEVTYGVASGRRDAALMVLGTGIGTAAMIDGTLLRGSHDHAGILGGHLTVDLTAPLCPCGNVGCAESLASTWALDGLLRADPEYTGSIWQLSSTVPDIEQLVGQAEAGEPVATRVLGRFITVWGATLVALCHAYDPDVVIVSGGVMKAARTVLPPLEAHLAAHLWSSSFRPRLLIPASPEYSVMRGLSAVASETPPERIHP